jgi:hypothetical protein
VEVLAADTEIHLGDQTGLPPPWKPLHRDFPPARAWQADFYVRDPGNSPWELSLEVMAANDRANHLSINGQAINPHVMQAREWDFAAYWVRHHFGVPRGILRPGQNVLRVEIGQWVPVYQSPQTLWDDLQIRNVYLRRLG